jgi:hypothetical protein
MDVLIIYTYVLAGITVAFLFQRRITSGLRFIFNPRICLFFPTCFERRAFWGRFSYLQVFFFVAYISGTLLCNVFGVSSLSQIGRRSASLALLHLIPCLCSPHLSLVAYYCDLPTSRSYILHKMAGSMAFLQSVVHIVLTLRSVSFDLDKHSMLYGFVVRLNLIE